MAYHGEIKEAALTLDGFTQLAGLLVGVLLFIGLLGRDTWKAIKKRAYWIPGDWLVLSALTIQLMNLLNGESSLLKNILDSPKPWHGEVVKNNLFMIHSSRVMLCVLVAYLLPGMARPGYEESWGKLAALVLSIFLHISSELFTVHRHLANSSLPLLSGYIHLWANVERVTEGSFIISGVIISITLVWLILLLSCATMANKSIRIIVCQRIPVILAKQSDGAENSWQAIEDQVLKSWIVARACYPESVIAKSVLASSAALAVTLCVLCSLGGWLAQGPIIHGFAGAQFWLKFITFILELVFILIGWAIIGWRCITSVTYYRTRERNEDTWRNLFSVEDFWTRHIVELQEARESKKGKGKVDERVSKMVVEEGTEIGLSVRLLRCVFWLQLSVVYFSKGCWFFSDLIWNNRFMHRVSSMLLSKHDRKLEKGISEYKQILANVNFLKETPKIVFASNRKSIRQAKDLMKEGNVDGKNCKTLIRFLTEYRKSTKCLGIQCLDSATSEYQTGLKFLWKRHLGAALDVEEHFICARKPSWKLTAVSLINIIFRLSPSRGTDALNAYSEASELINLVEDDEPKTDSFLSKAADSLFKTLQEQSAENAPGKSSQDTTTVASMEEAAAAIDKVAEESKMNAEIIGRGQDSLDWKKVAAGNASYKLCKSIDCRSSSDFPELMNELHSVLADIIGSCIDKVGAALVDNCKKWAVDLQERKLLKAVYIAGKSRGLIEQLKQCPSFHNSPSNRESLQ